MQYRYHEWTDKILSKRTAESIGASTLIGLKCGFDIVTITKPSGQILAKVTIGHKSTPSNSINDRLHLSPEQQNILTTIGCVITPDCIVTTEDTPIEFNIPNTQWNSKPIHAWLLVATHNYIEIPESPTTLQGGSPTTYTLVDIMDVITTAGGYQAFLDGYILTDEEGTLIQVANSVNNAITAYNSTVIGFIGNVVTETPTQREYIPIYDNVTPILRKVTEKDWDTIWEDLEEVKYQLETDLLAHIENKNNPHQVTKQQVGLGQIPNAKTDTVGVNDSNILATSRMVDESNPILYFGILYLDPEVTSLEATINVGVYGLINSIDNYMVMVNIIRLVQNSPSSNASFILNEYLLAVELQKNSLPANEVKVRVDYNNSSMVKTEPDKNNYRAQVMLIRKLPNQFPK